ncbi:MAG: superoxide dismutase [Fe] [Gammaproteobacteria bacterium]|nr:superoxide dismutase [Fe] [Gammaproteobacteria bacterium]|tara:strand:+ start:3217 stop:3828 length:612 start_codon:yes stop_codon:yes gene_type:complete
MAFELPSLPYAPTALTPNISEETIEFHHGKHHKTHVDNLNSLIIGSEFEGKSLEEIVKTSSGSIFNNAAEMWNHSFYWHCMTPEPSMRPTGAFADAIDRTFGSFDYFKEEFTQISLSIFGSGWAWLVRANDGSIELTSTTGAGNPIVNKKKPLLTCDLWEHAYYLDYRNSRLAYVKAFLELIDWGYVQARYIENDRNNQINPR